MIGVGMEFRNDHIESDLLVEGDLEFAGLAISRIHVLPGATLLLTGSVSQLSIEPGGRAIVRGTVTGSLISGGEVEIHGLVESLIETGPLASIVIHPGAIVAGTRR